MVNLHSVHLPILVVTKPEHEYTNISENDLKRQNQFKPFNIFVDRFCIDKEIAAYLTIYLVVTE